MIKIRISEKDAGQRMDKYLHKYLAKSTSSFLYKMLRKKNITLNGKKAAGNEMLQKEDEITTTLYPLFPNSFAKSYCLDIPPYFGSDE